MEAVPESVSIKRVSSSKTLAQPYERRSTENHRWSLLEGATESSTEMQGKLKVKIAQREDRSPTPAIMSLRVVLPRLFDSASRAPCAVSRDQF